MRTYKGLKVRDAKSAIMMHLNKEDILDARRGDPSNCAFALCIRRNLGAENVDILATKAYVEIRGDDPHWDMYIVPTKTHTFIMEFDGGNIKGVPSTTFALEPPTASRSVDYQPPKTGIPYHKDSEEAVSSATIVPRTPRKYVRKSAWVRNATGLPGVSR